MDLNLQPLASSCFVSGQPFLDGQRVASFLVNDPHSTEVLRFDLLEASIPAFKPQGAVVCRWVHPFKARKSGGENADRTLKLTAENLFLTLADPATEPSEETTRLLQFLGLMLERKRILKARGRTPDGQGMRFEHTRSKQIFVLPATELSPEFFVQVQEQLSVLVGAPKPKLTTAGNAATVATGTGTPVASEPGAKTETQASQGN